MSSPQEAGALVAVRGREWVVLPGSTAVALRLRPLVGSEEDVTVVLPALEAAAPKAARFTLPDPEECGTSAHAALLSDALRLALRRGAGPFRSAGRIAFEPRAYQLVPLIMALRLDPIRLLIADDVGIGKTIEAGLILREFMDRGETQRATILCPPHLVEQWVMELREKFDLAAVAVTAASARRLERGLPYGDSIFDAHPLTVVSLDYIKADRRRAEFRRKCPGFVIVDEAHTCVGGGARAASQRHALLVDLVDQPERDIVLLTATPHSGDADAFDRLVALLDPEFGDGSALSGDARARLSRHFVQRRRIDVRDEGWEEDDQGGGHLFPKHETADAPYILDADHLAFQDAVLDYCLGVTNAAGSGARERRLAFWGTLALMRCVGSSPAAAVSALRNRREGRSLEGDEDQLEGAVFDEEDDSLTDNDMEPVALGWEADALDALVTQGEKLARADKNPKFDKLLKTLRPLVKAGMRPVVFCRFIATAEAVGGALEQAFKKHAVEVVTGRIPGADRRERVEAMAVHEARILVATDCLSEGVNLQKLFDAVVHYDLSWNPTRHQQREGRVDRFGQPAKLVRSVTLFAENSPIDGAVLEVILRKSEEIRKATGVSVGMPADRAKLSSALMQAMLLRTGRTQQLALDLGEDDGTAAIASVEAEWRDAEENEKRSRAVFAQRRLKPEEVLPEWQRTKALLGSAEDAERFTRRAFRHLGTPLEEISQGYRAPLGALPDQVVEVLGSCGFTGSVKLSFDPAAPEGYTHLHRAHPIISALAERLGEGALESTRDRFTLARCGAWQATPLAQMTTLALLRIRHRISKRRAAGSDFLLAEEIALAAFEGISTTPSVVGDDALALFDLDPRTLPDAVRKTQIERAIERLSADPNVFEAIARRRADVLADDHNRLRVASGEGLATEVSPVLPPDLIGVWVLLPEPGA